MQPVFQGYPPYGSPQWIYPEDVQSRYTDTPGFCHSSYPDSYDPNVNQPLAISYASGISCNSAGSAPGWEISSGYSGSFFGRDAQSNLISAVNRHQTRSGAEIDRIELFGDEKQQFEGLVELALREWCERILERFRMVDLCVFFDKLIAEEEGYWKIKNDSNQDTLTCRVNKYDYSVEMSKQCSDGIQEIHQNDGPQSKYTSRTFRVKFEGGWVEIANPYKRKTREPRYKSRTRAAIAVLIKDHSGRQPDVDAQEPSKADSANPGLLVVNGSGGAQFNRIQG